MPIELIPAVSYALPPREEFFVSEPITRMPQTSWDEPFVPLLKELGWDQVEFVENNEDKEEDEDKVRTPYGHLARHFGPESNYSNKASALEELYLITLVLKDQYSTLRISANEKEAIKYKLHEDLDLCTPGYHNRITNIIKNLSLPKGLRGLLFRYREELIEQCVRKLSDDVHDHNRFYLIAYQSGYGVYPINENDPHPGQYSDDFIYEKLQDIFGYRYRPFAMVQAIQKTLKALLIEKYGYHGRLEEGYLQSDQNQFAELLRTYFNPGEPSGSESFLLSDYLLLSEDQLRIVDLDWVKINKKIWNLLNERGYFSWKQESVDQFDRYLASLDSDGESKDDFSSEGSLTVFSSLREYHVFLSLMLSDIERHKAMVLPYLKNKGDFISYARYLMDLKVPFFKYQTVSKKNQPLFLEILKEAILRDDLSLFRLLAEAGTPLSGSINNVLDDAVFYKKIKIIRYLREYQPNAFNEYYSSNVFRSAYHANAHDIVRYFIDEDIYQPTYGDEIFYPKVKAAKEEECVLLGKFIQGLAEPADYVQHPIKRFRRVAFLGAAARGQVAVMNALFEGGISPSVKCGVKTGLSLATENNQAGVIQYLVSKGERLRTERYAGESLLVVAANAGSYQALEYILEQKEIELLPRTEFLRAHLIATASNHPDVASLLEKRLASMPIAQNVNYPFFPGPSTSASQNLRRIPISSKKLKYN